MKKFARCVFAGGVAVAACTSDVPVQSIQRVQSADELAICSNNGTGSGFGDGADGPLVVSAGVVTINTEASPVTAAMDTKTLSGLGAFAASAGDLVLLHQTVGSTAGEWEFATLTNVSPHEVALPLLHTYTAGAQIVRVRRYSTVRLGGGVLTAPPWNGSTGGILALVASASVEASAGTIQMDGAGFRGGAGDGGGNRCASGFAGESATGLGAQGTAPNGAGGGGGGGGVSCCGGCPGGAPSVSGSPGGGGGGYGVDGTSGKGPAGKVGEPGVSFGNPDETLISFGGGGGGGAGNCGAGSPSGAAGGGIVYIAAPSVIVSGGATVSSRGGTPPGIPGNWEGGPGAGAGGAVFIGAQSATLTDGSLIASGGVGGLTCTYGGDGAVGRVRLAVAALVATAPGNPAANTTGFCAFSTCTKNSDCASSAPFCDVRSRVCGACNGDFASSATRACTSAAAGACDSVTGQCAACVVDTQCVTTSFCDATAKLCAPKAANGSAVPTSPGHTPELGGVCTVDAGRAGCLSGTCSASDNLCGLRAGEAPSSAASGVTECRSGIVGSDAKCGLVNGEAPSSVAAGAVECRSGVVGSDGRCGLLNGAQPTSVAAAGTECRSGIAGSDGRCGLANGEGTCTVAAQGVVCRSASCSPTDGKCGLANTETPSSVAAGVRECRAGAVGDDGACGLRTGQACGGDLQCRSNACLPSGKCDGDSDGDGVSDAVELTLGSDPAKKDSDGDGVDDNVELSATRSGMGPFTAIDTDGDGTIDAKDTDDDGDGLTTASELGAGGGARPLDTDGDGRPDYVDADDDGDSIPTKQERSDASAAGKNDDVDGDGKKNWLDTDADGDGIPDGAEKGDANRNGVPDYLEASAAVSADSGTALPDSGALASNDAAGVPAVAVAPPLQLAEGGSLEGGGVKCSASSRSASESTRPWLFGAAFALALVRLRARAQRSL